MAFKNFMASFNRDVMNRERRQLQQYSSTILFNFRSRERGARPVP